MGYYVEELFCLEGEAAPLVLLLGVGLAWLVLVRVWAGKELTERAGPSLTMSCSGAVCELSRFGKEP